MYSVGVVSHTKDEFHILGGLFGYLESVGELSFITEESKFSEEIIGLHDDT